MKQKSVMSHQFSRVPAANIERSTFDRSHGTKTTFDGGFLVPIYLDEALPGDTFNMRMSAFARLATPLKPIMDNLHLETFFFAVPYRLLWENWEKFNGAQDNPADPVAFTVPQMVAPNFGAGGIAIGSLSDYMQLPAGPLNAANTGLVFNSLHHRAYNLIYNEWFRDENLQDSVVVDIDNGPDTYGDYVLKRRGKRHDYFTSCLPWPQKTADVEITFGGTAPVTRVANAPAWNVYDAGTENLAVGVTNTAMSVAGVFEDGVGDDLSLDPMTGLTADLSSATPITINELREAVQLQKMYERDARGGTRYTELVKSHFKVTSPDARLQRSEYLGGGSTPIVVHPVSQQSASAVPPTSVNAQGNLAGFGTASCNGHGFSKSFTEHCILIGMVNVRADLTYQYGLNRMFSRRTRFDYYWPALSHLGEQAVLNKELYAQGEAVAADELVFGYQERHAEYRYKPSTITGAYRSIHATPLDMYHFAQEHVALPTLGTAFISEEPPIDRCIAVPAEPHFLFDAYFSLRTARPMPVYGVPGQMDRF